MSQNKITKEAVIVEYLTGNISFRKLGSKYSIPPTTIRDWVRAYQKKLPGKPEKVVIQESDAEIPSDIDSLRKELRKEKLHVKLLEAIIQLVNNETGLDWRKKSGTKQS